MPSGVLPPGVSRKSARTSNQTGGATVRTVRTVRQLSVPVGEAPRAWSDGRRHECPNRPMWPPCRPTKSPINPGCRTSRTIRTMLPVVTLAQAGCSGSARCRPCWRPGSRRQPARRTTRPGALAARWRMAAIWSASVFSQGTAHASGLHLTQREFSGATPLRRGHPQSPRHAMPCWPLPRMGSCPARHLAPWLASPRRG